MREIQDGTYAAKAIRAELGESSTGKEQASILFELTEPGFEGERLTYYGYFTTDKAVEFSHKALRAAGWQGHDIGELVGGVDLGGKIVSLVCEQEMYRDKLYTKIKFVNEPGSGFAVKPMAADKARAFAARMKAKLAALDQSAGMKPTARSASPAKSAPANEAGDDAPF